ncbi:hypothetical protein [Tritonibacter mobilis]|uniref:hypothetical protein n=1 Tax=Tritonibacter mobilis TaxID=379347 RepID=UPI000806AA50|nr:hypothetical protein [Tritonibacter mobilis]NKX39659.1 hypothetical protein [Rhodobacteraceae bacterium R_SAG5]GLP88274.1 hypothetical protein GCM10007921_38360 [Tritonibacter mobilis]SDY10740.1 hypothetical protein SAMN05444385_1302 [Tritonibacter mobilis]
MLTLSNETIARLDSIQINRDINAIAEWLYGKFEPWFLEIGAKPHDVARSVRQIQQWAEVKALKRNKDIRILAVMSVTQGAFFHHDPRFSKTFNRAVRRFELEPDERINGVFEAFEGWRNNVLGKDSWGIIAQRTASLITNKSNFDHLTPAEIADRILPGQAAWIGTKAHKQFLWDVAADGAGRMLPTHRHLACNLALSVLFGYRWASDPKMINLAKKMKLEPDPNVMCEGVALQLAGRGD